MSQIPAAVNPLFQEYVSHVARGQPPLVAAFYVVGSIALDEFNERWSDIDFVTVLTHPVTRDEMRRLAEIHERIERAYPRWKMSGTYLQRGEIGKLELSNPYLHYHDGVLHPARTGEWNEITWWILKHAGITLLGTPAQELDLKVNWERLIADMHINLNTYWRAWANRPGKFAVLLSDWGVQWAVLGVLRQYYTFRESSIISKVRAGEYALQSLPLIQHKVVREAIRIRQGDSKPLYRLRIMRAMEVVALLRFVIRQCNAEGTP